MRLAALVQATSPSNKTATVNSTDPSRLSTVTQQPTITMLETITRLNSEFAASTTSSAQPSNMPFIASKIRPMVGGSNFTVTDIEAVFEETDVDGNERDAVIFTDLLVLSNSSSNTSFIDSKGKNSSTDSSHSLSPIEFAEVTTQPPEPLFVTEFSNQKKRKRNKGKARRNQNENSGPAPDGVQGLIGSLLSGTEKIGEDESSLDGLIASAIQNSDSISESMKGDGEQTLSSLAQSIIDAQARANPNATESKSDATEQSSPSPEELQQLIQSALEQAEEEQKEKTDEEKDPDEPTVEEVQQLIANNLNTRQGGKNRNNSQKRSGNRQPGKRVNKSNGRPLDAIVQATSTVIEPTNLARGQKRRNKSQINLDDVAQETQTLDFTATEANALNQNESAIVNFISNASGQNMVAEPSGTKSQLRRGASLEKRQDPKRSRPVRKRGRPARLVASQGGVSSQGGVVTQGGVSSQGGVVTQGGVANQGNVASVNSFDADQSNSLDAVTNLQVSQKDKTALKKLRKQDKAEKRAARKARRQKLISRDSVAAETFDEEEQFKNTDISFDVESSNSLGLALNIENKNSQSISLSERSGKFSGSGTKLEVGQGLAYEEFIESESFEEMEDLFQDDLSAGVTSKDSLGAWQNSLSQNEANFNAVQKQEVSSGQISSNFGNGNLIMQPLLF